MKEKLITIDYEEYLELEKCKGVIEDLKDSFKNTMQVHGNIVSQTSSIHTNLPNSFCSMFREELRRADYLDSITLVKNLEAINNGYL